MTTNPTILDVFHKQMAAYGERNVEQLMTTFSEDCVLQDMADPAAPFEGHAAARGFLVDYFADLANVDVNITKVAQNEDTVFGELDVTADWVSEPFSPESPRRVNFKYVIVDTFRDGLVVHERFYWDSESLQKQLVVSEDA
ncbi:hypothetical protein JOF28_001934 [Leucobacter exalbidus]|uniref:SnoaL-like domain-containing protein n=1 Tax=Leucobacter exalbidus TaxID=662960 RepID=A0A940T3Z5_9MICO|nr:nuclear transport factor 2 family protein [Leucobacter exalbidus]MBP1326702.1 hypothetical protein [Leucobacter exalbidus]